MVAAQVSGFSLVQTRRRKAPEADVQVSVVRLLRIILVPPAMVWFCPNGGNLSAAQAGRFKAMGLLPGAHDLHLVWPDRGFGTIEMKKPLGPRGGKGGSEPSDEQELFGGRVAACGHRWAEARSVEDVLAIIDRWGVPHRRVEVLPNGMVWLRK
jgi:hypothetical protein